MGDGRKYPLERAVRLVFESGRPVQQVARDLGVHHEALRLWVRQAEADSGRRRDLLTSDEREELKRTNVSAMARPAGAGLPREETAPGLPFRDTAHAGRKTSRTTLGGPPHTAIC